MTKQSTVTKTLIKGFWQKLKNITCCTLTGEIIELLGQTRTALICTDTRFVFCSLTSFIFIIKS